MRFYRLEDGSGRYLGMEDSVSDRSLEQIPELISGGLIDTSYEKTYSEKDFQHATNPPAATWHNTLTNHAMRISSEELMQLGFQLGYTYFAWNGCIFKITNYHQDLSYELVEDIYEIDLDKNNT